MSLTFQVFLTQQYNYDFYLENIEFDSWKKNWFIIKC